MKIQDFKLERYFGIHEFSAKYMMSSSDCDGYAMSDVLALANEHELTLWNNLKLGYTESQGHPLLLDAISKHYTKVHPENSVVASPGELNFALINVLLSEGDHVVVVSPSYQSLYEILKSLKCNISYWEPEETDWTFEVDQLNELVTPETKLIIINFPHNPTGSYLTSDQQLAIVDIARANDCYIFSDEMYFKLVHGDTIPLPAIADIYEKGISLWGTSKTMGLAGLRLGWLVSQDQGVIQSVLKFKDYLSICSNAPSEILAMIALNNLSSFLNPNLQKINRNVALFQEFQIEYAEIFPKFIAPRAGSTSFVPVNCRGSMKKWSDELVAQTGIMTVPSEMFEYGGRYIRVGFGRENFSEVLDVLRKHLIDNA